MFDIFNFRRNKKVGFSIIPLLLFFALSCQDKQQNSEIIAQQKNSQPIQIEKLPETEAGGIVKNSIEQAGGWENWKAKKSVSYTKVIRFLDSTGKEERVVKQLHKYQLQPELKMKITWEENGDNYSIVNNGQQAWKLKNGSILKSEEEVNSAWNSSFGSQYVLCMPFKLADPGTNLEYEGVDTLQNGNAVQSIKVTYDEGAGSAGGMHTWWYYFDKNDHNLVANKLDYGDGFSYTDYDDIVEVSGIKIPATRRSYKINAEGEPLYVTTTYENSNISFNEEFEEGIFKAPSEE